MKRLWLDFNKPAQRLAKFGTRLTDGKKYRPNYIHKLFISYLVILSLAILIMSVPSFIYIRGNIIDQTIQSNKKLLDQFKRTIDGIVLRSVDQISLSIANSVYSKPYIQQYINRPINNNYYSMLAVQSYFEDIRTTNPLIHSLGIYIRANDLFLSTELIRYPDRDPYRQSQELDYYSDLIERTPETSWFIDGNYHFKYNNYVLIQPTNLLHTVRKVAQSRNADYDFAVIISLKMDELYQLVMKSSPSDFDNLMITNNDGAILLQTDQNSIRQNISEFEYGAAITGSAQYSDHFITSVDQVSSVATFSRSDFSDWKFITVTPMTAYSNMSSYIRQLILIIAAISGLIGVIAAVFTTSRLSNPIRKAVSLCQRIIQSPAPRHVDEYNIIYNTLNDLSVGMQEKERKIKEMQPVVQTSFLSELLSGRPVDDVSLSTMLKVLDIQFPHPKFCVVATKLSSLPFKNIIEYEYEKLRFAAYQEQVFDAIEAVSVQCEIDGTIASIVNYPIDDRELIENVEQSLGRGLDRPEGRIYVSFGKPVLRVRQLSESYSAAAQGLMYSFLYPDRRFFYADEVKAWEASLQTDDERAFNQFCDAFKAIRKQDTLDALERYISELTGGGYSYDYVRESTAMMCAFVNGMLSRLPVEYTPFPEGDSDPSAEAFDIYDLRKRLETAVDRAFDYLDNKHARNNERLVQSVQTYIQNNAYDSQISLSSVADAFQVSTSHLSRIFKSVTTMSFTDFLTKVRLDHCCALLRDTSLHIEEISQKVGYSSPQYLIKRFKIEFGCTPNDYRRNLKVEDQEWVDEDQVLTRSVS